MLAYNGLGLSELEQITIEESLGAGENKMHRADSLRQCGSSDVKRGQNLEAEARATRPRPISGG